MRSHGEVVLSKNVALVVGGLNARFGSLPGEVGHGNEPRHITLLLPPHPFDSRSNFASELVLSLNRGWHCRSQVVGEDQAVYSIDVTDGGTERVPRPVILQFHISAERGPGGDALLLQRVVDIDNHVCGGFDGDRRKRVLV